MTSAEEISKGIEAEYLANHPVIKDAFAKVEAGIINAMRDAPMGDEKTHNRLVIAMQLLKQIERQLNDVITTGKLAKLQVNDKSQLLKAVGF